MSHVSRRSVAALALCGLSCASGCSLQSPLGTDTASQLNGRWLSRTERRGPPFSSAQPMAVPGGAMVGGALGGLVAAAMLQPTGQVFDQNSVVDPALAISRRLSRDLERHYGLRHAQRLIPFDSDDVTKVTAAAPSADVVIDIWTDDWSLVQHHEDLSKFHLHYSASMRLIDARAVHAIDGKTGAVIAEGTCERAPDEPSSAATRDQFLADGARRLKAELKQAEQACVHDFRARLLPAH
jgi:hypothetical protein